MREAGFKCLSHRSRPIYSHNETLPTKECVRLSVKPHRQIAALLMVDDVVRLVVEAGTNVAVRLAEELLKTRRIRC